MSNKSTELIQSDTPMMKQYREIKEKHPDAFLFFRCGDFYEMFGPDAVNAASILDITLTKRGDIPMCGVPYHSVDIYIAKMIKSGKKIAICEQMEDPRQVKSIVKRDVVQIVTPGTLIEENLLANKYNNFLFALNIKGLTIEIAYLDLSTGDFECNEIEYTDDLMLLKGEMVRINPREVIIPEDIWINNENIRLLFQEYEHILINRYPQWYFKSNENKEYLFNHFKIKSWDDLHIKDFATDLTTPQVLLKYVNENAKSLLDHIRSLHWHQSKDIMVLDETTIKNLEIINNLRDGSSVNSLLEIMDDTITAMGGRLLKKWLIEPLINNQLIQKRLEIVNYFYTHQSQLNQIEKYLKQVMDLERLVTRIVMNKANPKDLISIKISLQNCHEIFNLIQNIECLMEWKKELHYLDELVTLITTVIKDEPATSINEGNIVREGYHKELDELKTLNLKSKEILNEMESKLRKNFDAPSLKIKYNKILGYFFEVSKLQSKNLDDQFILRQSLVNTHRYTTKDLSQYESKILTAKDKINSIEEELFHFVKDKIFEKLADIQGNAKLIARIDVLTNFAKVAIKNHYIKPDVNYSDQIKIIEGRHPVVEQKLDVNEFIPNQINLGMDDDYLLIITGPNMSGKSTYLRQNALIVLLAQIGSFIPAKEAEIGIVDRIFTRIGTSDNLARGQSTFYVEMLETANILKNASAKSLIIMDEIGRGTSTYDGLSIAWSVLEYIHNKKILGAKTLFATHYHELTMLDQKKGIKNLSVAISEEDDNITFLHKIIDEPAQKSYGIHVAQLANMPDEVILYAEGLLKKLEESESKNTNIQEALENQQMELFDFKGVQEKKQSSKIIEQLKFINLNQITPMDALNLLSDIQKKLNK